MSKSKHTSHLTSSPSRSLHILNNFQSHRPILKIWTRGSGRFHHERQNAKEELRGEGISPIFALDEHYHKCRETLNPGAGSDACRAPLRWETPVQGPSPEAPKSRGFAKPRAGSGR